MSQWWTYNETEDRDDFVKPTVRALAEYLAHCSKESMNRKGEEMSSHKSPFTINIYDQNGEYYELVGASMARFNCGCESGVDIYIRAPKKSE